MTKERFDFLIRGVDQTGKTVYLAIEEEGVGGVIVRCLIDKVGPVTSFNKIEAVPLWLVAPERTVSGGKFN